VIWTTSNKYFYTIAVEWRNHFSINQLFIAANEDGRLNIVESYDNRFLGYNGTLMANHNAAKLGLFSKNNPSPDIVPVYDFIFL
jgi:hypothetical protein